MDKVNHVGASIVSEKAGPLLCEFVGVPRLEGVPSDAEHTAAASALVKECLKDSH